MNAVSVWGGTLISGSGPSIFEDIGMRFFAKGGETKGPPDSLTCRNTRLICKLHDAHVMESDALIRGLNGRYDAVTLGNNCMNSGCLPWPQNP